MSYPLTCVRPHLQQVAEVGSAVPALDLPADAEAAVETCISLRKQVVVSAWTHVSMNEIYFFVNYFAV